MNIQYVYTTILQIIVYILLFDTFIPCQLFIKVTNLVLCAITFVGFPDDDPLWIETCRNIQCDTVM